MAGWYYPDYIPQQRLPQFTAGTPATVNDPPRLLIAAMVALIGVSWPVSYDPQPYLAAMQPKIAAFFPGAVPTVYTGWSLDSALMTLDNPNYFLDGTGPSEIVNNPPFAQRVPVVSNDPARPLYGLGFHYGFRLRGGGVVASVVNAPPPYSAADNIALRESWPQDSWPTQTLNGNEIQPSFGVEPPGYPAVPELDAYRWPTWDTQYSAKVVTTVPPAVVNTPPPYSVADNMALRQVWPMDAWATQSSYNPVVVYTITYGAQPTPASIAARMATRAAWLPDSWPVQSASLGVAQIPPIVNAPPAYSAAPLFATRMGWPADAWPAQAPYNPVAPLSLGYGQQPPPYTIAALMALRLASEPVWWPAQVARSLGTVANQPPLLDPDRFVLLRSTWPQTTWDAQHAAQPAATISAPPGSLPARMALVRALWPQDTWPAQEFDFTAAITPTKPAFSFVYPALLRSTWADATWSAQRAPKLAQFTDAPPKQSRAMQMAVRGTWGETTWTPPSTNRLALSSVYTDIPYRSPQIQLVATWQPTSWTVQRAPVSPNVAPPPVINAPPRYSTAVLQLIVNSWIPGPPAPPSTSVLSGGPHVGQLVSDADFIVTLPARAFTVMWLPKDWDA